MSQPEGPEVGRTLPKLDRTAVQLALFGVIELGGDLVAACAAAGIKVETAHRWLNRGRGQRERGVLGKYRAFLEQYELALQRPVSDAIRRHARNRKKDPWLNDKYLEKLAAAGLAPEHFAPIDVATALRAQRQRFFVAVKAEFAHEPETLARFLDALIRAGRGEGAGTTLPAAPAPLAEASGAVHAVPVEGQPRLPAAVPPEATVSGPRED